jgi:hypothetical protein
MKRALFLFPLFIWFHLYSELSLLCTYSKKDFKGWRFQNFDLNFLKFLLHFNFFVTFFYFYIKSKVLKNLIQKIKFSTLAFFLVAL